MYQKCTRFRSTVVEVVEVRNGMLLTSMIAAM